MAPGAVSAEQERIYPLKRPKNHNPPVPRWTLRYPDNIETIHIVYVGVQSHNVQFKTGRNARVAAVDAIKLWLKPSDHAPIHFEHFRTTNGFDIVGSDVWVSYWTDKSVFDSAMANLHLTQIYSNLPEDKSCVGIWLETFSVPLGNFETNYTGTDYRPGVAQIPDTTLARHTLSQYWGAARDRIPASGWDSFDRASERETDPPKETPKGIGEILSGKNEYDNLAHIRSGQWWQKCPADECEAYETDLQKALMGGMDYLWSNPTEAGTVGLRFLQNLNPEDDETPWKETCGAGFHRSLHDLEKWSRSHPSHLKIYNGAKKHAETWGENRKFRTWHEVAVLKKGQAKWKYINCAPETGVIKHVNGLKREALSDVIPDQTNGA